MLSTDGVIGGGRVGSAESAVIDKSTRGDVLGYFDGDEEQWPGNGLQRCLAKMNTLVSELREVQEHSHAEGCGTIRNELRNVTSRSKGMVTCYPGGGSGYQRHVDNAIGNGRKLTCIYYANSRDWDSVRDGGSLALHAPINQAEECDGGRVTDIAPIFNRLLIFWSDCRCPHEVMPCYRERFAITAWFIDSVEKAQALQEEATRASNTCQLHTPVSEPASVDKNHVIMSSEDGQIVLQIGLAPCCSPKDVSIDITETIVRITRTNIEGIEEITLPFEVDRGASRAKYKSKLNVIVVTLPARLQHL